MARIITVSGPTFSGKTYIVAKLIKDLPDLKVVYFEKHYNKKDINASYINFYADIERYRDLGNDVICESVYCPERNPIVKKAFENAINIVCMPDSSSHSNNYKKFLRTYGWDVAKKRLGGCSISHARDNYSPSIPKTYLLYNGKNYSQILERIKGELCGK